MQIIQMLVWLEGKKVRKCIDERPSEPNDYATCWLITWLTANPIHTKYSLYTISLFTRLVSLDYFYLIHTAVFFYTYPSDSIFFSFFLPNWVVLFYVLGSIQSLAKLQNHRIATYEEYIHNTRDTPLRNQNPRVCIYRRSAHFHTQSPVRESVTADERCASRIIAIVRTGVAFWCVENGTRLQRAAVYWVISTLVILLSQLPCMFWCTKKLLGKIVFFCQLFFMFVLK